MRSNLSLTTLKEDSLVNLWLSSGIDLGLSIISTLGIELGSNIVALGLRFRDRCNLIKLGYRRLASIRAVVRAPVVADGEGEARNGCDEVVRLRLSGASDD